MKKFKCILITLIIILVVLSTIFYVIYHKSKVEKLHGKVDVKIPVQVFMVKNPNTKIQLQAHGSVISNEVVILKAQAAGLVTNVYFTDGESVNKGEKLYQLDDRQAKASLNLEEAKYQLSKNNLSRGNQLYKNHVFSKQEYETLKTKFKEDKANYQSASVQLSNLTVLAPFHGDLGRRLVNVGDYISVGESLVKIVNDKDLRVVYHLPEKDVPLINLRQDTKIYVANANQFFQGKVIYIAPYVDDNSREVTVESSVINPSREILPGMFVSVKQTIQSQSGKVNIPEKSVHKNDNGSYIFLVTSNDTARKVNVVVGSIHNGMVSVLDGEIKPGDKVIVQSPLSLASDILVKPVESINKEGV